MRDREIDGQIVENNKIRAKLDEQQMATENAKNQLDSRAGHPLYNAQINCDITPQMVVVLTCPTPQCPLPIGGLCTLGARQLQRY